MNLTPDSAYRISYKTRDSLLRFFDGVYRGKEPLYLVPGDEKGLRFDSLRPGKPVAYTIPEALVYSVDELAYEVDMGPHGKRQVWKDMSA